VRATLDNARRVATDPLLDRKFWREHLPRLKFWNPAIPMIVNRTTDQLGPATMTLYFRDDGAPAAAKSELPQPSSSSTGHSKAPEPSEGERAVTIDMKNRLSEVILKDFMDMTGAVPVIPTPQEEAEMRDAAELKQRGEIDRERVRKMLEAERREAAMISQARSEAAALKATA
jgi:large subunit ribosomal protein MRP49